MKNNRESRISKYMSYLLRHDPESLEMSVSGFVDLDRFLKKVNERFKVDKKQIFHIAETSSRKRFEIVGNEIRALYGHTIPVKLKLNEDKFTSTFYHGTTPDAASEILKFGLKSMKRTWVHLSPTMEIAKEVALRKTRNPIILEIDAASARNNGLRFYKATNKVYLCNQVPPEHIKNSTTE